MICIGRQRSREGRPNRRFREAFSLIEMLSVMGVIGIVLGFSAIGLSALRSNDINYSTREFADFLNYCRSEAIAKHTAIRVGIVMPETGDEFRRYSAWAWNRKRRQFEQLTSWRELRPQVKFETEVVDGRLPFYVMGSSYAEQDASSIRGHYLLGNSANQFVYEDKANGKMKLVYFQFGPSGRAEAPGIEMRDLVVIVRPEISSEKNRVENWAQINVDTLTGRYQIYRP